MSVCFVLTLEGYAAMILRVKTSAAVSEQLRTHFALDERLGGGQRRSTGISRRKTASHSPSRRCSDRSGPSILRGSQELDLTCRRDVLVSRLVHRGAGKLARTWE